MRWTALRPSPARLPPCSSAASQPGQLRRRQAAPVVGHADAGFAFLPRDRADFHPLARAAGGQGIEYHVLHRLLDAQQVAIDGHFAFGRPALELHAAGFGPRREVRADIVQQLAHRYAAALQVDAPLDQAGDVEQFIDHAAQESGLALERIGGAADHCRRGTRMAHHLHRRRQRRERIAQFVAERAEEGIDAVLLVAQGAFGALLVVDVGDRAAPPPDRRVVAVAQRPHVHEVPAQGAVVAAIAALDAERLPAGVRVQPCCHGAFVVLRVHGLGPVADDGAGVFRPAVIEPVAGAIGFGDPDQFRQVVQHATLLVFATAQRHFGPPLGGGVHAQHHAAVHAAVGLDVGRERGEPPARLA